MPDGKTYDGGTVYLTDLIKRPLTSLTLEGFTFVGCQICGPAVVGLIENTNFIDCMWQVSNRDSIFIEIPENSRKAGIVGLLNCSFVECTFAGVAVAGTAAVLATLRANTAE